MPTNGNPNIIPFDDARRMASTRSSRMFEGGVSDGFDLSSPAERLRPDARVASSRVAARSARDTGAYGSGGAWPEMAHPSSRDISLASPARASSRFAESDAAQPVRSAASDFFEDRAYRDGYSRAALEVYDPGLQEEGERSSGASRRSRAQEKRRAKTKERANRLFDRQFGPDEPASSPHASRAAVYKGEMGRSHKRAFADLESGRKRASTGSGASSSRTREARKGVSPLAVFVVVLGCFVVALAMLFPPARQYYIETREQARLQAEYDALSARNQAIESHLEYLKTDEGIEDVAHKELGWVHDGQVAGVVQGLDSSGATAGQALIAQVKSGSVPAPETWYSPVLDTVFGYVDPVTVMPENTDLSNVSDVSDSRADEGDSQDS